MIRRSMTYGTLPAMCEYDAAFWAECPDGRFMFVNDLRVGTCELSCSELWDELKRATAQFLDGSEPSGYWASAVLGILGFEWV